MVGAIPVGICQGAKYGWGNPGGNLPGVWLGGFAAIPEGICQVYGWVVGRMIAVQGAWLPCRAHDCRAGHMIAVQGELGKGRITQLLCVKRMRNSDVRWGREHVK